MANTVSVTCYAQHSSYQNICLNKNNSSSWAPNELIYICIWAAVAYKYQSEIFFYFQFLSKLYRRGFLRWLETSTQPLALGKDSKWILFLRQRNLLILMLKKVDVTEISHIHLTWLREPDLNRRPSGYEPDELPSCSIPRYTTLLFFTALLL